MRPSGDFARRHPWRQAMLTGGSLALALTAVNLINGRPWDVIALGLGIGLVLTLLVGLLLPLASRPRARSSRDPEG